MDRFAELLFDLSKLWNVELFADKKHFCRFHYKNELHVQLEFDEAKERILIASFLCEIPPGKYRENLLKEALKSNYIYPRVGTLAYSDRNNQLALFEYTYLQGLNAEKLAKILEKFFEKGHEWKIAVEKGTPLPSTSPQIKGRDSLFGLK